MARIRRCNRGARGWEEVCEVLAHTREVDRVLEFHCLKALVNRKKESEVRQIGDKFSCPLFGFVDNEGQKRDAGLDCLFGVRN